MSLQLEQHKDCIYDRVVFWETSESGAPLASICGSITKRQIVTKKSNQMVIRLLSDNSVQKTGFELSFVRELDECTSGANLCEQICVNTVGSFKCDCYVGYSLRPDGKTCESTCGGFLRASHGSFASPNFPQLYPPSKNCVWEIEADSGYQIFLNFTSFNIEGMKTECAYDYVKIGESEKLCGEYGKF
ncbi:unnamed protein product [Nippostrongylus brasiliensis]|uniref:CUB domain-containing protein n=1 Tax=Nippostrongylus brasiliensis TaxID=27835 RepID=A0A0N4XK30_NIPBR|nr:unnamed protein product [Nippostrongylus brasiliensis]